MTPAPPALPARAVDGASAQAMFQTLQQHAANAGVPLRPPPPGAWRSAP